MQPVATDPGFPLVSVRAASCRVGRNLHRPGLNEFAGLTAVAFKLDHVAVLASRAHPPKTATVTSSLTAILRACFGVIARERCVHVSSERRAPGRRALRKLAGGSSEHGVTAISSKRP